MKYAFFLEYNRWLISRMILEYIGNIPPDERDQVINDLNRESARLIKVLNKTLPCMFTLTVEVCVKDCFVGGLTCSCNKE
jgi:hypothetical protein